MPKEIRFDNDTHQYFLDGVNIPSVSALTKYALNEDFSNVPPEVLKQASDFGSGIHELLQIYEETGNEVEEEYKTIESWKKTKEQYKIETIAMENIVYTDDYAGRYDTLAFVNDELCLIDFKTNRVYPKEHLEVQMGLYKNAMNDVKKCYCFWLDKAKKEWHFRLVNEITKEECDEIVEGFKNGLPAPSRQNDLVSITSYSPTQIEKLKAFYDLKKEVDEFEKMVKEVAMQKMTENDLDSIEDEYFKFTRVNGYETTQVDTKKLKDDGIYEKYSKPKKVSPSVRVTLKWL